MQQNKNIIVISCSRDKPLLTNSLMQKIQKITASPGKVLWPQISSEFYVENSHNAKNIFKKIQTICEGKEIDLNIIQNNKNYIRRKKLLLADMDNTLIKGETLDEIANIAGMGEKVKKITALSMEGKLNFKQSLIERVALLKNQPSNLLEIVKENITYNSGAKELINTMQMNGSKCALVSGGFEIIANKVKEELNIDYLQANNLEIKNGRITGKVKAPIHDNNSKLNKLNLLVEQLNITIKNTCAIGDGANDLKMIKASGMGVSFRGKLYLKKNSQYNLNFSDLTGLLFLQGYTKNEIEI